MRAVAMRKCRYRISLLTVLLARRYTRGFFSAACIWATRIIFSSVYLGYHYVFDLIIFGISHSRPDTQRSFMI